MVNTTRPKTALSNLEPAPFAQNDVLGRDAHIGEPQVHVAMRGVIGTEHLHGPQHLDARCVGIHHKHGVALMLGCVGVGAGHHNVQPAPRIACAGNPPFVAVQHIVIAIAPCLERQLGCIGRRHIGFRHHIGRADIAVQKRHQPAVFHPLFAVAFQHFHIAGVRRITIEHLGRDSDLAHFLGQIGVFHGAQAIATVTIRQPEIPKPAFFCLGLQPIQNFQLAVCVLEPVARRMRSDLGVEFGVQRGNIVFHHIAHRFDQRAHPIRDP